MEKYNNTLVKAAEDGNLKVVKYMIDNGADIHYNNDQALVYSNENGHYDVVRYLLEKGANANVLKRPNINMSRDVGNIRASVYRSDEEESTSDDEEYNKYGSNILATRQYDDDD